MKTEMTHSGDILLVDDDPDLLKLISLRLTSAGYRVRTADSGETALAALAVARPAAVITDLKMPGIDGLTLFDAIHRQHPTLPVIILTAHGTIPDAVSATQRGVFGFLTKPFDSQELLQKVAAAVRQVGGRVSATTPPADHLPLAHAVRAYRHEDRIARDRGRLQGQPVSWTPRDLERDDHATGLIRLLSIGLRVLTRLEFVVRRGVAAAHTTLAGLDAGHPPRSTSRPTAERLRQAFQDLPLTIIQEGRRRRSHLTPLSRLHQRILALLDFPVVIDTGLCGDFRKPPYK